MKKSLIIAISAITFGSATAQKLNETEVPTPVKEAFSKKYPGAKAKWEKEGSDFEAGFDLNKIESSAVFSANGEFKELEQEIKTSELPKSISDYCSKNFASYKIDEAARITEASGTVNYEAEMKKGKEHFDALFDKQGGFIKRSESSTKED